MLLHRHSEHELFTNNTKKYNTQQSRQDVYTQIQQEENTQRKI